MKTNPVPITKLLVAESLDGEIYQGNDHSEVVAEMRATAWGGESSAGIVGYMKQVAKRIHDWSGRAIRVDNAEHFLHDMEKEGLLRLRWNG